jgi:hypothetical protein
MVPERGLASCLQELSSLEVEPLEVLVYLPQSQQDNSLYALTTTMGDLDVTAVLTGTLPRNDDNCCCCCCCPFACCCC